MNLLNYIDELIRVNVQYDLLVINLIIKDINSEMSLQDRMKKVSLYILDYNYAKVFTNVGNEFILVFRRDAYKLSDKFDNLRAQLSNIEEELNVSFSYLLIKDTNIFNSGNELLIALREYMECVVSDVLSKADSICYFTKFEYDKLQEQQATKRMIESALHDDRILIYLQPIYSTTKKKFVSAEVLVRIIDLDGTVIQPYKFIDVAERTGLISCIEDIVFEKSCKMIKAEKLWNLGLEYIEINLSVKKCESKKLHEKYQVILEKYNIEPSRINLEITETASISAKENLLKNMNTMIAEGIRFSLDDFGSGNSNLNYIIEMPVSIVKFDKDMTQGYFTNPKAKRVMTATIGMIHQLGLKVVAEGVEEKEQLDAMIDLGVAYIQGYFFSKPIPQKDFVNFIRSYNG